MIILPNRLHSSPVLSSCLCSRLTCCAGTSRVAHFFLRAISLRIRFGCLLQTTQLWRSGPGFMAAATSVKIQDCWFQQPAHIPLWKQREPIVHWDSGIPCRLGPCRLEQQPHVHPDKQTSAHARGRGSDCIVVPVAWFRPALRSVRGAAVTLQSVVPGRRSAARPAHLIPA